MSGFLDTAECAALLKAMGDPTRLSILRCLVDGERSVTDLSRALKLPQPSASHHLAILRVAGLIRASRTGRRVIYALHPAPARQLDKMEGRLDLGCCAVSLRPS